VEKWRVQRLVLYGVETVRNQEKDSRGSAYPFLYIYLHSFFLFFFTTPPGPTNSFNRKKRLTRQKVNLVVFFFSWVLYFLGLLNIFGIFIVRFSCLTLLVWKTKKKKNLGSLG
jgi:hypothetical protein